MTYSIKTWVLVLQIKQSEKGHFYVKYVKEECQLCSYDKNKMNSPFCSLNMKIVYQSSHLDYAIIFQI
jgi:hypothetical protein